MGVREGERERERRGRRREFVSGGCVS